MQMNNFNVHKPVCSQLRGHKVDTETSESVEMFGVNTNSDQDDVRDGPLNDSKTVVICDTDEAYKSEVMRVSRQLCRPPGLV